MPKHKQTILITGAAKRIGAALARHFAACGHSLVLHYANSAREAKTLATELRDQGSTVTLVRADFRDAKALATFWNELPPVHAMIHNASLFTRDTLPNLSAQTLRDHLAVHLEAPLLLAKGFLRQLPKRHQGSVVLLGDATFGWSLAPQFFSYAISKHAVTAALDILAAALAPRARANLLMLGPTLEGVMDDQQTFAMLARQSPLQRTGTPQEVCAAAAYLLDATGVTGQQLSLANGFDLRSFRRGFPPA